MKATLWAVLLVAACARPAPCPPVGEAPFAAGFAAAVSEHDAERFAALFATDGALVAVGESETWSGRAAIRDAFAGMIERYPDVRVAIGRTWVGPAASVIEVVVTATHGERAIGAVGAIVVERDSAGLATTMRLYLDLVTLVGQLDPAQLPAGAKVREPVSAPPAGTATTVAAATPTERANLAATDAILARLVAHDPAGVMAFSSDDYVYDDFSGPAPLDRAATLQLLENFLGQAKDFAIVATPTHFAAGDDVVVEQIEHLTLGGTELTLHSIDVKHFVNGVVVREWQFADASEIAVQLGHARFQLADSGVRPRTGDGGVRGEADQEARRRLRAGHGGAGEGCRLAGGAAAVRRQRQLVRAAHPGPAGRARRERQRGWRGIHRG